LSLALAAGKRRLRVQRALDPRDRVAATRLQIESRLWWVEPARFAVSPSQPFIAGQRRNSRGRRGTRVKCFTHDDTRDEFSDASVILFTCGAETFAYLPGSLSQSPRRPANRA
jgi:hypothetical protein